MRRRLALVALLAALAAPVVASRAVPDGEPQIKISPHVLVLSRPAEWVTVHTNVPYSTVDTRTLDLNGVAVSLAKADDCGDLVAKFDFDAIAAIVEPPRAALVLSGCLKDGTAFSAAEVVTVRSR